MGRKTSDEQCIENYNRMKDYFNSVIPDHERFEVVYAAGVDVGMMNFAVVRRTTYTYSSYAIGYDRAANEIVVLPIDRELDAHGQPYYLKNADIKKAKQSMLSKEITVMDKSLPKQYIQFTVQEQLNDDPDEVCLCVKQNEQARDFQDFFKSRYKK